MKKYLLIDDNGQGVCILDEVLTDSYGRAVIYFRMKKFWNMGEIVSEEEYLEDLKNECDLNGLESISFE